MILLQSRGRTHGHLNGKSPGVIRGGGAALRITLSDRDRDRLLEALNRPGRSILALVKIIWTHQEHHSGWNGHQYQMAAGRPSPAFFHRRRPAGLRHQDWVSQQESLQFCSAGEFVPQKPEGWAFSVSIPAGIETQSRKWRRGRRQKATEKM